jgi:hypothetical protein
MPRFRRARINQIHYCSRLIPRLRRVPLLFAILIRVGNFLSCGPSLRRKPRYVLINRAPLVEGPAFATVQDGVRYRLACFPL